MQLTRPDKIPFPKNCDISNFEKIKDLYWKLLRFCIENEYSYISSVQVGIPLRFYILQYDKLGFLGFANAEYDPIDTKKISSVEGCASLPDTRIKLKRYKVIRVEGYIVHPKYENLIEFNQEVKNKYSILHQHVLDHQNGVLINNLGHEYVE